MPWKKPATAKTGGVNNLVQARTAGRGKKVSPMIILKNVNAFSSPPPVSQPQSATGEGGIGMSGSASREARQRGGSSHASDSDGQRRILRSQGNSRCPTNSLCEGRQQLL